MKLFKKGHNMNAHILIGIATIITLWYINQKYNWIPVPTDMRSIILLVLIGVIYSIITDVDQPGSKINKYSTVALIAVIVYSFYNPLYKQYGIISAIVLGLLRLIEHRTLIHSVLGAAIISAPLFYLGPLYFTVGFIAFLSHIISDNDFSLGWEKDWRIW